MKYKCISSPPPTKRKTFYEMVRVDHLFLPLRCNWFSTTRAYRSVVDILEAELPFSQPIVGSKGRGREGRGGEGEARAF